MDKVRPWWISNIQQEYCCSQGVECCLKKPHLDHKSWDNGHIKYAAT